MVINGSCSTNMCARQLSFHFSFMVWGGMAIGRLIDDLGDKDTDVGHNVDWVTLGGI